MSCTQACNQGRNCTCRQSYKAVLQKAQWEAEQNRPYDWADRLVIRASLIAIVCLLVILAAPQ